VATQLSADPLDRAFERMYERYVKDVYRYALAVLRNPADAEDVTQTTFMNAYRAMKDGEEPIKPQHWLIKIAHNACRTRAIRASRRPREVPIDETVGELSLPEQERPNVKAILSALGQLPFNQRSALVMRELEGRTYEEIADALDVSVSAVETLIFRARRSLRLKREALRGLLVVPLPASLESFGSNAMSAGGMALGGGAVAKAAAVLAAVIAGGASYEAVDSATKATKPSHKAAQQQIAIAAVVPVGGTAAGGHLAHTSFGAVRAAAHTTAKARRPAVPAAPTGPAATVAPVATPAVATPPVVDVAGRAAQPQAPAALPGGADATPVPGPHTVPPLPAPPLPVPAPAVPPVSAPPLPALPVPSGPQPPSLPAPPSGPSIMPLTGGPAVPPAPVRSLSDPPAGPPLP
jgi:RNA polymerase sigma factor (sigma-70 family)